MKTNLEIIQENSLVDYLQRRSFERLIEVIKRTVAPDSTTLEGLVYELGALLLKEKRADPQVGITVKSPDGLHKGHFMTYVKAEYGLHGYAIAKDGTDLVIHFLGSELDLYDYPNAKVQPINLVANQHNPMSLATVCYVIDLTEYPFTSKLRTWYRLKDLDISPNQELMHCGSILEETKALVPGFKSHAELLPLAIRTVYDNQLLRESQVDFATIESRIADEARHPTLLGESGYAYAQKILSIGKCYKQIMDNYQGHVYGLLDDE